MRKNYYDDENYDRKGRRAASNKRRRKTHKGRNSIILLFELIVILGLLWVLRSVVYPYSKMKQITLNETQIVAEMNKGVEENPVFKDYTTIALFGVDSTGGVLMGKDTSSSTGTRTDVIMVASINNRTGDVKLCSVYRDTFVDIGDNNYTKINAAYSYGGPDQAIKTLNRNLDLNITEFVTIGFEGLTDIVNSLGGVELDIQEDAIIHLNNYQLTMAEEMGISYTPLEHGGLQTVNGLQATAYCRVRYIAGSDLGRAQHQRDVLKAILEKAKKVAKEKDIATLVSLANTILPKVATSLSISDISGIVSGVGKYNFAGESGIPQTDMLSYGNIPGSGSCVIAMDLAKNVRWLHSYLYNNSDYTLTPDCQSNSDRIYSQSSPYAQ